MTRESKIGIFVLVGLAVMGYFVFRTTEVKKWLSGEADAVREVAIIMEDASGMREGTSVEIAGVRVGKVQRIELEGEHALAFIQIPDDMLFKDGAYAQIRSKGVLGERYVALYTGTGNVLPTQDRINGTTPPDLGEITATVKQLGDNLVAITEAMKQSTRNEQGGNRLVAISGNIEKLTAALVTMLDENRTNMTTSSAEIAALAQSLNRDIPVLVAELTEFTKGLRSMSTANRPNIDATMDNITQLSKNFEETSKNLSAITDKVNQGQGSLGKLINEPDTANKLNEVLDNVNNSLGQVQQLLGKANDIEIDLLYRTEYFQEFETTKNYFGLRIIPDESKFYRIEGVTIGDELEIKQYNEVTEETFDADGNLLTRTVRTQLEKPDDFLFNAQLAYRVGPVFLRGGILESEGGGGIDWFSDSGLLKVSLDAFDFNREDLSAHGRLDFRVSFSKNIYFNAGWDDFLESERNSAVLGAGLRWKDDDLKLLFTQAGRFL